MNTIEQELHKKSGALIKDIPKDGHYRSFKVGREEWFAIAFEDCGTFGCLGKKEIYGWNGGRAWLVPIEEKQPQVTRRQYNEEQKIVAIGNALMDGGQLMTEENLDRYILALGRVIEFNGRQQK